MRFLRFLCMVPLVLTATTQAASAEPGKVRQRPNAVPEEYIVVLKQDLPSGAVRGIANELAHRHGGLILHYYEHAFRGFALRMSESEAQPLSHDPRIDFIEQNQEAQPSAIQINPSNWALDRIDQRNTPMDAQYSYNTTGQGVNAYVIDSGINMGHTELTGRAFLAKDYVNDGLNGGDCYGHGTAVAGILGGTTHGVAKGANLYSVRIAGCTGATTAATTAAALDWLSWHHVDPAVANLSYNFYCSSNCTVGCATPTVVDIAAQGLINQGVTLVNSAGNCEGVVASSPASLWDVLVVGAVTFSSGDRRVTGTSYGGTLDVFAPGWNLTTASHSSSTGTTQFYYTSAAAPVVAGAVARYLETNPNATPSQAQANIVNNATSGIVLNVSSGNNKLLYIQP